MVIFISLITGSLISVLDGFVVAKLWNWFVVSFFHAPVLPTGIAIGVLCLISYFYKPFILQQSSKVDKSTKEGKIAEIIFARQLTSVMMTLFIWGEGAVVHWWIR